MTAESPVPPPPAGAPSFPAQLLYAARPERLTTTESGTVRSPLPGEVAHDFNLTDAFLAEALTPFLEALRASIGVRIWDGSSWVQAHLYISSEDPATLPVPPSEPYVWLQTPGGAA